MHSQVEALLSLSDLQQAGVFAHRAQSGRETKEWILSVTRSPISPQGVEDQNATTRLLTIFLSARYFRSTELCPVSAGGKRGTSILITDGDAGRGWAASSKLAEKRLNLGLTEVRSSKVSYDQNRAAKFWRDAEQLVQLAASETFRLASILT